MKLTEYSPECLSLINKMIVPDADVSASIKFLWCDIIKCKSNVSKEHNILHSHSFFEVIFAAGGKLTYTLENKNIIIEDGSFAMFRPGVSHSLISGDDNSYKISLTFMLDEKSELFKTLMNSDSVKPIRLERVNDMFDFILHRSEEDDVFASPLIRGKLLEITYIALKAMDITIPKNTIHSCDARVNFAKEYIEKNKNRLLGGGEVASACNLSLKQLNRIFVSDTGVTVYDYITEIKLKEAKKLILGDGLSIKEIAFRLGFETESSFSSFFKRHSGMSAGAFKRHCTLNGENN